MKEALTDADVRYGAFGGKTDSVEVKNGRSNPPLLQKSSWFGNKPQGYAWVYYVYVHQVFPLSFQKEVIKE